MDRVSNWANQAQMCPLLTVAIKGLGIVFERVAVAILRLFMVLLKNGDFSRSWH